MLESVALPSRLRQVVGMLKTACPGCGVELPVRDGPTDLYGGASAACWALYGEVLAREFSDAKHFAVHRLSVDAYMAQHPSQVSRAAVQSVWVHLAGLHLVLDRCLPAPRVGRMLARLTHRNFEWLEPPLSRGASNVAQVAVAAEAEEHLQAVERWARETWQAWALHHAAVRALVAQLVKTG